MMIKLKNIFKNKLSEESIPTKSAGIPTPEELEATTAGIEELGQAMKDAGQAMKDSGLTNESDLAEAELVNHMYDYRGGVEYILRDPSQAEEVIQAIAQWTERKGFTIITKNISKSGRVGYFHFRLGQDPERDAQRIQGYFSSKIEIAKYRFKVRETRRRPQRRAPRAPQPEI
jgi:hypothetical protein